MAQRQLGAKAVRPQDLTSLSDLIVSGAIAGLTISNDNTVPATVLDFAIGMAADTTGVQLMRSATPFTKSIAATWVIGTGAGGLDTGTVATGTYHCHMIYNPTTGVSDFLFSLSPTAPTLPTGFTLFRRIASILYASSAITPFSQLGNEFLLKASSQDVNGANYPTTTNTLIALSVPTGIKVDALVAGQLTSATANMLLAISSPDTVGGFNRGNVAGTVLTAGAYSSFNVTGVRTNIAGQLIFYGNAAYTLYAGVSGWIDNRDVSNGSVAFTSVINNVIAFPSGVSGLTLSIDSVQINNGVNVAPGIAADVTGVALMQLTTAFGKNLAIAWAPGSGIGNTSVGSSDTGAAIVGSSWYYIFLISTPAGVVDILSSLSATAPTLPAGYTLFRRIGSVKYISTALRPFRQVGNRIYWMDASPVQDYTNLALTATTHTAISVAGNIPPYVDCTGIFGGWWSSATVGAQLSITPLGSLAGQPNSTCAVEIVANATSPISEVEVDIQASATPQISAYCSAAGTMQGGAKGFIDNLGAPSAGAVVVTQVQASLAYGRIPGYFQPTYISRAQGISNSVATANTAYFMPLLIEHDAPTITKLVLRIAVAVTGNAQMAIYANNPATNRPTGAPLSSLSAVVSTGTVGIVEGTLTTPLTLQPGLYWVAVVGNAAFNTYNCTHGVLTEYVGATVNTLVMPTALVTQTSGYSTPMTYAAGGMATATGATLTAVQTYVPMIAYYASAIALANPIG